MYEEIDHRKREELEKGLQAIFTPWQVRILRKRASGEPLSDAERQEVSRRIKPKILAIESLRDVKLLLPFFS